jgi:radical SAM protein with 4Fe4S-binding SPASM domain
MGFESFPYVIGWELTLACNLRCRHCASSAGAPRERELTIEESLAICDQFPALLVQEVIFTGGEPLLNPHWEAISTRLRDLEIKTGVVTNGLSLSNETIIRMKHCGLVSVAVSIDGLEDVHDQIRGIPGAFQKTLSGAARCVENGIDLSVITSVTGLNVDTLDEIYRQVRSIGAWKWQLQPLFPTGRSRKDDALRLSDEQFLAIGKYAHELRPKAKEQGVEVVPADSCGYFSPLDFEEFGWQGCTAGRTTCGIMSDGRIKGCLSWPDEIIEGDLRQDELWTIWFRPEAFAALRTFTPANMSGACQTCDVAQQCGGGCQAMSLAMTGRWHADPYCYRRILARDPVVARIS